MVLLFPKLQSLFAEFLQYDSLKRLNLFNLFTCVGFSTVFCLSYISRRSNFYFKFLFLKEKNFYLNDVWTKNILLEIAFAHISLKTDYLRADYPFSENLELSAIMFLNLHYLSLLMLALSSLVHHIFLQKYLKYFQSVPLPSNSNWIRCFGMKSWVPIYFRSKNAGQLSYYALSQGWLPPSLPLCCKRIISFFIT